MTQRQVKQPLVSYRDADGSWRHALLNEQVQVHPEYLEEFDKLNEPDRPPPKAKGPAVTEPVPDSRRSVKKAAAKAAGREPRK